MTIPVMHKTETAIGGMVSVSLVTLPAWVKELQQYMEFAVVACGLAIGLTTLAINLYRLREIRKGAKK